MEFQMQRFFGPEFIGEASEITSWGFSKLQRSMILSVRNAGSFARRVRPKARNMRASYDPCKDPRKLLTAQQEIVTQFTLEL